MVKTFNLEGALRSQQAKSRAEAEAQSRQAALDSGNGFAAMNLSATGNRPSGGGGGGGDDDGGFWNLPGVSHVKDGLGTYLNYALKTSLAPMEGLGYLGRSTVGGYSELAKLTPDSMTDVLKYNPLTAPGAFVDEWMRDDEDFESGADRSFIDRVSDRSYGFGSASKDTGNAWIDNTAGFVGDAALDPTSYVTLGAGRFAGLTGRMAAAKILSEAVDSGGKRLFTDAAIATVRRKGVSHADEAMRAQLGLGDHGLRFAGKTIRGTGGAADTTGRALSTTRDYIMSGPIGKKISWFRSNKDFRKELDLVAGRIKGTADEVQTAAEVLMAGDIDRLARTNIVRRFENRPFMKALQKRRGSDGGLNGLPGRKSMTHVLEQGDGAGDELYEEAHRLRNLLFEVARKAGISGLRYRSNYVKHIWTRKARRLLEGGNVSRMTKGGRVQVSRAESAGAAFERNFGVGTYEIRSQSGKKYSVELEEGTIEEINRKIGGALADNPNADPGGHFVKVLEDDYGIIWQETVNAMAKDIGNATALRRLQEFAPDHVKAWNSLAGTKVDLEGMLRGEAAHVVARKGESAADAAKRQIRDGESLAEWRKRVGAKEARNAKNRAATRQRRLDEFLKSRGAAAANVDASWDAAMTPSFIQWGRDGQLGKEIKDMIDGEFEILSTRLFAQGDELLMGPQMRESFQPIIDASKQKWFWEVLDDYTRMFKTYATMTPGFHIRNGYSAAFMNLSDGIGAEDHVEAFRWYNRWMKEGDDMFKDPNIPPHIEPAFNAMSASGVQGAMSPVEQGISRGAAWEDHLPTGRAGDAIARGVNLAVDNPLSSASKSFGTDRVEGPFRLAAALNTTKRYGADGMDAAVDEATARVVRLHFDYSQLSEFDQGMKKIIPFWTFMSRNLPLQIQQMYLKPKMYQRYALLRKNFDMGREDDIMPGSWEEAGGFRFSEGSNWAAMPDLPFTRMEDGMRSFNPLNPRGILRSINPAMRVPLELFFDEKFYSEQPFYPDENKWLYALSNTLPMVGRADSLSGGGLTKLAGGDDSYKRDQWQTAMASFFGAPFKEITQRKVDSELRRLASEANGR